MTDMEQYGIWPPYEAFYIEAIFFNARSALVSCHEITGYLKSLESKALNRSEPDGQHDQILDSLQNLFAKGAALSRYFWPSRDGKNQEHQRRAELLRKAFSVTGESPLKDRELRNCMEHFDERLDHYLSEQRFGQLVPSYVGTMPKNCNVPLHVFRAYYYDIGVFEILGTRYQVKPIVDEIVRLYGVLEQCAAEGYRLPREAPYA